MGRGRSRERGASGADGAPVCVVESAVVVTSGRPIEANGAEVEGHASDTDQKMVRRGQTASVPEQDLADFRLNPFPPCLSA